MDRSELFSSLKLDRFIAFDFETTGLQVETDRAIEVAAIMFKDGKPAEKFVTLINPQIPISDLIADITGITNEMVTEAPLEKEIIDDLFEFLGDYPIVAHNTPFDLSFLRAMAERHNKDFIERKCYDTLTLSRAFLFFQPTHNLSAVSEYFNLSSEGAHRAEKDTENCGEVFIELVHEVASYNLDLISNIITFLNPFEVHNKDLFINIGNLLTKKGNLKTAIVSSELAKPQNKNIFFHDAKTNINTTNSVDVFGENGLLNQTFDSYELRPNQINFSEYVDNILSGQGGIGVIEAGTGLGKSMAYLYPAIKYSHDNSNENPIILSCYTKHLQDQLFNNDLPTLTKAIDTSIKAVLLKGRNNYLCKTRLRWLINSSDKMLSGEEAMNLLPVLVWLEHTSTGDLDECPGFSNGFTYRLMGLIQSEQGFCTSSICAKHDGCFFGPLRKVAYQSNLIVVNHALLISDAQSKSNIDDSMGFLPENNAVIIDEAHNLPKAAYHQLTLSFDHRSLNYILDRIDPKHNHSVRWNNKLRTIAAIHSKFEISRSTLSGLVEEGRDLIKIFFDKMTSNAYHHFDPNSKYSTKIIIDDLNEHFTPLEKELNELKSALHSLRNHIRKLREDLLDIDETREDFIELHQLFDRSEGSLSDILILTESITSNQNKEYVYWYEGNFRTISGATQLILTVNMAPIQPGIELANSIFKSIDFCILTSATLRTKLSFDYFLNRVGLDSVEFDDVSSTVYESPFSYNDQVTYFQYAGNDSQRPDIIAKTILHCHRKFNKRMMVLFTSRAQLDNTSQLLRQLSHKADLPIFAQKRQTSRMGLIRGMKQVKNGILLGTNAFWEGVDLPGDLLEVLMIIKMPFDVPTEPTVKAYGKMIEERGGNSFMDYALPESVIRFRQGFGRLIRTTYDEGIFIVMDDRIINKRYGISFSESIPVQMQVFRHIDDI
jgi:ATP-dependent DNA helicase DinG